MVTAGKNYSSNELRDRISHFAGRERVPKNVNVITDTTDFFRVNFDDVLILGNIPYFIRNYEREGRFGIDDEPKFWVRRAINLLNGNAHIIKLVFKERFTARVGDVAFECIRSPQKEARVLELVSGHPNFMQGFGVADSARNSVRVIEYIHGKTFADHISEMGFPHETYFHTVFPRELDDFIELTEAIKFIHDRGEKHGDIRRDHILKDSRTGLCRWIDFDFNYIHRESMFGYDLFGLGNILAFITGRGDVTVQNLKKNDPSIFNRLTPDDTNIIFHNRVVNLKKVYPYIPEGLNLILMHFSAGANIFYDSTDQLLADLREIREDLVHYDPERSG